MTSERIQKQINRLLDEAEQTVLDHQLDVVRARAQSVLAFDPENKMRLRLLLRRTGRLRMRGRVGPRR